MPVVEHVVKLFTLTDAYGQIAAFDSHASDAFIGTSGGYLLHLVVEGIRSIAHTSANFLSSSHTSEISGDAGIFTTVAQCIQVNKNGAVSQIQHSRTQRVLLVRCDAALSVWRADTLQLLYQFDSDVGMFFYAPVSNRSPSASRGVNASISAPSLSAPDPLGGAGGSSGIAPGTHTRTVSTASQASGHTADASLPSSTVVTSLATDACSQPEPDAMTVSQAPSCFSSRSSRVPGREVHGAVVMPALRDGPSARVFIVPRSNPKLIKVVELTLTASLVTSTTDSKTSPEPKNVQTFELPEPVVSLCSHRETLCVRTRRQCSILSLRTGASQQIARFRSEDGSAHPALAVCTDTAELYLAHRQSVLRGVDMDASAGSALGSRRQSTGILPDSSSGGGGAPRDPPATLHNCHTTSEPVRALVTRHPHLFVFTDHACDVLSIAAPSTGRDRESRHRLSRQIPTNHTGVSSMSTAATVVEALVTERLAMPGIRFSSPLSRGDNVLVASQDTVWMMTVYPLRFILAQLVVQGHIDDAFEVLQRRRRRVPLGELESVELELHILAGFAHLRQGNPQEALTHLAHRIDPRDVLLHIPECIPVSPVSEAVKRVCAKLTDTTGTHEANVPHTVGGEGAYWSGWEGPCPYNTPAGQLQREWLQFFDQCPAAPNSTVTNTPSLRTASGSLVRIVPSAGPMTAAVFLETTWEWFKDAVVLYLRSRLRDDGDVLSPPQRRAVAYALLVLMLERQDHRGAYHLVAHDPHLSLEDAYDLLVTLREYRLVALLLFRSGLAREAQDVLRAFVYTSSVLGGALSVGPGIPPLPSHFEDRAVRRQYAALCWDRVGERAGIALQCLPPAVRWPLATQLGIGPRHNRTKNRDVVRRGHEHDSETETWTEAQRWTALQAWHRSALEGLLTQRARRVMAFPDDGGVTTSYLLFDCAAEAQAEDGDGHVKDNAVVVPGSLCEVFYLVDHMNLPALQQLLEEQPSLASVRDEEGSTLLHAVMSLLVVAFASATPDAPLSQAQNLEGSAMCSQTQQTQSALLEAVLAAASLLVDCGCPVNAVNLCAQTAIDVAAEVSLGSGTACVDVVVSALAAMTHVNMALSTS